MTKKSPFKGVCQLSNAHEIKTNIWNVAMVDFVIKVNITMHLILPSNWLQENKSQLLFFSLVLTMVNSRLCVVV